VARTRRNEKTVEIHEFYVFRTASGSLPPICSQCPPGESIMVTPEQAAAVTHVPERMIYRWVESGLVHYREEPNGSISVCVKSLPSPVIKTEEK
jgi:hypothetical protein